MNECERGGAKCRRESIVNENSKVAPPGLSSFRHPCTGLPQARKLLISYLIIPEKSCQIEDRNGYLKNVCYNGNKEYREQKCLYSEEYYSWDTEKDHYYEMDYFLFRGVVCSNDPHYYQLCDKEIGGKVTNNKLLCEYFLCDVDHSPINKKRLLVSTELGGAMQGELTCKNTDLNKEDLLKADTKLPSKVEIHSSQICDGKCDVRHCEDEGLCDGYNYGFHCHRIADGKFKFVAPIEFCNNKQFCKNGKDEENCTVTGTKSCKHVMTGEQVPVLNYTSCSKIDLGFYGSVAFSYCEISDIALYQTNCSDPSRVGVTCKIHGYETTVSKALICEYENVDVCDDRIEEECLKTKSCKIHKHQMCDGKNDCSDEADETDVSCLTTTEATCKRRVGNKTELNIPLHWLNDGVKDCEDGIDETSDWPTCGVGKLLRFVSSEEVKCSNVFICKTGDPGYEELENLCDGLERCGNENGVCSVSNRPESLAISVPTTNRGLTKSLKYCLQGLGNIEELVNAVCITKQFLFPDENIFGASKTSVILPNKTQVCDFMFGEQYLYTSCTGFCTNSSCPLKTKPRYEVCPSQVPNRIGTIVNNEYLIFVTKSYGNVFTNRYFVCDDKKKCIDYSKVCDLINDCDDGSDEDMCTNHFICNSSTKFIPKTKKCDGHIDCFDFSDECNEQCSKEILKGYLLKAVSWLIGLLAVLANLTIIVKCLMTLNRCKTLPALMNRLLILVIALGDFSIGCYLVIIASFDTVVFKTSYCHRQFVWITGFECSIIGVISTIGSQISLFSMTCLSIVRMHGIWNSMKIPGEITRIKLLKAVSVILILIFSSAAIAVIPLMASFEDYFVNGVKFSDKIKIFIGQSSKKTVLEVIKAYYGRARDTTPDWKILIEMVKGMFSHDLYYEDPTTKVDKVNFYGNDGVCLFKYFVQNDDPQRLFVWSILALNFVCFAFISASYLVIGILSRRSSKSLSSQQNNQMIKKRNNQMNQKIAIIITTDFLCWIPFIIICMLHSLEIIDATPWYSIMSMIILPLNSVINPLLYDDTATESMKAVSRASSTWIGRRLLRRRALIEAKTEAITNATRDAIVEATREAVREATKEAMIEAAREVIIEVTREAISKALREEARECTKVAMIEATKGTTIIEIAREAEEDTAEIFKKAIIEAAEETIGMAIEDYTANNKGAKEEAAETTKTAVSEAEEKTVHEAIIKTTKEVREEDKEITKEAADEAIIETARDTKEAALTTKEAIIEAEEDTAGEAIIETARDTNEAALTTKEAIIEAGEEKASGAITDRATGAREEAIVTTEEAIVKAAKEIGEAIIETVECAREEPREEPTVTKKEAIVEALKQTTREGTGQVTQGETNKEKDEEAKDEETTKERTPDLHDLHDSEI